MEVTLKEVQIILLSGLFIVAYCFCVAMMTYVYKKRILSLRMNNGLKNILKRRLADNEKEVTISILANEIEEFYSTFIEKHSDIRKKHKSIANWLQEELMKINTDSKWEKRINLHGRLRSNLENYYETLLELISYFEAKYPFANFPAVQEKILTDAKEIIKMNDVLMRIQDEFSRCNSDINDSKRMNRRSLVIGAIGILATITTFVLIQIL